MFLAQKGFTVDAVDISEVGLSEFAGRHPRIRTLCADLDQFEIPANRYDLIVNVKFLSRRLFPYLRQGLKPDGVLIFHSLLETDHTKTNPQHRREYLLRKNELLRAFLTMRIIYYREDADPETDYTDDMATLVAIKR